MFDQELAEFTAWITGPFHGNYSWTWQPATPGNIPSHVAVEVHVRPEEEVFEMSSNWMRNEAPRAADAAGIEYMTHEVDTVITVFAMILTLHYCTPYELNLKDQLVPYQQACQAFADATVNVPLSDEWYRYVLQGDLGAEHTYMILSNQSVNASALMETLNKQSDYTHWLFTSDDANATEWLNDNEGIAMVHSVICVWAQDDPDKTLVTDHFELWDRICRMNPLLMYRTGAESSVLSDITYEVLTIRFANNYTSDIFDMAVRSCAMDDRISDEYAFYCATSTHPNVKEVIRANKNVNDRIRVLATT